MSATSTAITRASLDQQMNWARSIAAAGNLIPQAFRDPAKVLVAIQYGAMLDVNPLVAMNDIYVIEGTPSMSAHLMSATVRRAGHVLRVRTTGTWGGTGSNAFTATATLIRSDDPEPFTATWTEERAKRAGLLGKNNWKNYPEAMCKARAISEVCRDGASEALMGIKYTADEISDLPVSETGEVIEDAEVVEDNSAEEWRALIEDAQSLDELAAVWSDAQTAHALNVFLDGQPIGDIMRARKADLLEAQKQQQAGEPEPAPEGAYDEDVPF